MLPQRIWGINDNLNRHVSDNVSSILRHALSITHDLPHDMVGKWSKRRPGGSPDQRRPRRLRRRRRRMAHGDELTLLWEKVAERQHGEVLRGEEQLVTVHIQAREGVASLRCAEVSKGSRLVGRARHTCST